VCREASRREHTKITPLYCTDRGAVASGP
jgi:hypothetical protein